MNLARQEPSRRAAPRTLSLPALSERRKALWREASNALLRVAVDDRAEQLPFLAGKFHHLNLLDRIEIRRRGLDADSRDIGVDLEIHVRDYLHDVLPRQVVAAALQHLYQ